MTKTVALCLVATAAITLAQPGRTQERPPFSGTVYVDPDVITAEDPTTYASLSYVTSKEAEYYDYQLDDWLFGEFFVYRATYRDGDTVDLYVEDEFETKLAGADIAEIYAVILGQMPKVLRTPVERIFLHREGDSWTAERGEISIHHGTYLSDLRDGWLEESMLHETVHASFDYMHDSAPQWREAQRADGSFISTYARDYWSTEDIAESFVMYYAVTMSADRIPASVIEEIETTIPNRLAYFAQVFPRSQFGL